MSEAAERGSGSAAATIRVNGRRREVEPGLTVQDLLEELEIFAAYALVERNGEPVARASFATTEVSHGDELVVARPVAGG